jgi:hypothetical protein
VKKGFDTKLWDLRSNEFDLNWPPFSSFVLPFWASISISQLTEQQRNCSTFDVRRMGDCSTKKKEEGG